MKMTEQQALLVLKHSKIAFFSLLKKKNFFRSFTTICEKKENVIRAN